MNKIEFLARKLCEVEKIDPDSKKIICNNGDPYGVKQNAWKLFIPHVEMILSYIDSFEKN